MQERIKYLDYSKGYVIILMLMAHTMSGTGYLRTYISSFHMQFFFVVCGVINGYKYHDRSLDRISFLNHIKKRLYQIGVPYFVFCLILALFYSFLDILAGKDTQMLYLLWRICTLQGIDSLWFLPAFFFAEILGILVNQLPLKIRIWAFSVFVIFLCIFNDMMPDSHFIRLCIKSLIGLVYVCYGYELELEKGLFKLSRVAALILFVAGLVLTYINGFSAIGSLELGNIVLFFLNAGCSCTAILYFFKLIESNININFLLLFGKNTIVVLCTNNILIESIRLLDYKLTDNVLLKTGIIGSLIFTFLLVIIEIPIINISNSILAPIFGRKRR